MVNMLAEDGEGCVVVLVNKKGEGSSTVVLVSKEGEGSVVVLMSKAEEGSVVVLRTKRTVVWSCWRTRKRRGFVTQLLGALTPKCACCLLARIDQR